MTKVPKLKKASLEVRKEFITQSRHHLFKTCWKNYQVQLHVNFSKNDQTLLNSQMHVFNVSITTLQSLKNVSLMV
jgi:hypothetical protein